MAGRDTAATRERLLDAACEIIAAKGYARATHQEICDAAQANIAAVNYHFGSKEQLYEAVWERAWQLSEETHGVTAATGDTPREILADYMRRRMECVMDEGPGGWFPRILFHAFRQDDEHLRDRLFERHVIQGLDYLHQLIRDVLGPNATEPQVQACAFSVHSQCVHLNGILNLERRQGLPKTHGPHVRPAELVDWLIEACVGGVLAVRDSIEKEAA